MDMPGPGEYEVDQYPMNQANIAYWIGTDVRRDLSVPMAYMYPGPGSYEATDTDVKQPSVSFPKEPKVTYVEKTNAPGPATYSNYGTVGVMPAYQRNNANAREVAVTNKKNDESGFFQ